MYDFLSAHFDCLLKKAYTVQTLNSNIIFTYNSGKMCFEPNITEKTNCGMLLLKNVWTRNIA
jgi:hypothetical protein